MTGTTRRAALAAFSDLTEPQPASAPATGAPTDTPAPAPGTAWAGPIAVEGDLTGDGRVIAPGALYWDTLPIPFRVVVSDVGGHDGAEVCGRIDSLTRLDGGLIWGEGVFDTASPTGTEAARLVAEGMRTGVSIDTDDVDFEVRVAADLVPSDLIEGVEDPNGGDPGPFEVGPDGRVKVAEMSSDDEVTVIRSARIRAATIVAVPAFEQARISLVAAATDGDPSSHPSHAYEDVDDDRLTPDALAALTASAIPAEPPEAWFADPGLTGPTAIYVTRDGRVFGHLAVWGTCHIGLPGRCVEPPRSPSNYAYFRTGAVYTAEGTQVAVGHITLGTGHAGPAASARAAAEHYDNTGTVVVDVAAGEDAHGIWVAGAVRPGTTPDQIRALRAAPLSGDWRTIGGNLELVGALAVNVPGFPVPRPRGKIAADEMVTLVAAGVVAPDVALSAASAPVPRVDRPRPTSAPAPSPAPSEVTAAAGPSGGPALTVGDLAYLKGLAQSARRAEARRVSTASRLADRVDRSLAAAKVRQTARMLRNV